MSNVVKFTPHNLLTPVGATYSGVTLFVNDTGTIGTYLTLRELNR